jgi:hypothetical protein
MSREEKAFIAASLVIYGESLDEQRKDIERKRR